MTSLHDPTPADTAFPGCLLDLSHRELDVLLEVANDLTNAEIGQRLHLSAKSVANYRNRIAGKLDMVGPRLLARFARRYRNELAYWHTLLTNKLPPPEI